MNSMHKSPQGSRRDLLRGALLLGLGSTLASFAAAQTAFPNKTVTLIHPFPAGGLSDMIIRQIQPKLSERLGVPVVVDNRPGASGEIGAQLVSRSAPDGYTLLVVPDSVVVNPVSKKQPVDEIFKRFQPVALLVQKPLVMLIQNEIDATDLRKFIAYAKANPGKLNFGSAGYATSTYLGVEYMMDVAGFSMTHIPFQGPPPMIQAMQRGDVQFMLGDSGLAQRMKDKVRPIALTSSLPARDLPNVQPVSAQGFPGFEFSYYLGVWAPAGTPADIVNKLSQEFANVLASPEISTRLRADGNDPNYMNPAALERFTRAEFERWDKLVKARNLKFE